MPRRGYSKEIRETALRKWESGKTPKEISKEMGIGLVTLYRWYHQKMAEGGHDEGGRVVRAADRQEATGYSSRTNGKTL